MILHAEMQSLVVGLGCASTNSAGAIFGEGKRILHLPFTIPVPSRTLFWVEKGSIVLDQTIGVDEELWRDDDLDGRNGWFCVRTDPFPCPASGCTYVADFMTAAHLILVWQENDDPNLLRHAARAVEVGRNPRIVGYQEDYGPSASYYAWIAAGRPVHGVRAT